MMSKNKSSLEVLQEDSWVVKFWWKDDILLCQQRINTVMFDITDQWIMLPFIEPLNLEKKGIVKITIEKVEVEE